MRAASFGRLLAATSLLAAACSSERAPSRAESAPAPTGRLVGVYPEQFQCDSIATPAELASALGAEVRSIDGSMATPRGVPRPCNYALSVADAGVEAWTFDIDCRPNALATAEALFTQYRTTSAALVESYAAAKEAGKAVAADGGPPAKAPEAAHDVEVGARALDHHGQGLLFVDDDAPCYVRVVGPDAGRRMALARLVAANLTLEKAPMTPRAAPLK
jgi:hypothetical protein